MGDAPPPGDEEMKQPHMHSIMHHITVHPIVNHRPLQPMDALAMMRLVGMGMGAQGTISQVRGGQQVVMLVL